MAAEHELVEPFPIDDLQFALGVELLFLTAEVLYTNCRYEFEV